MHALADLTRTIFDNLDLMAFAFDLRGVVTFSEGGALKAIGVAPGQTVGLSVFEMYGDDSSSARNIRRVLRGESFVALDHEHGRDLETRFTPLRDPSGAVTGGTGVTVDVTDKLRNERTLHEHNAALHKQAELLDLAQDAIMVRRLDGSLTYWNRGAERVYGHTRAEALGRTSHALLHTRFPTDQAAIDAELLATDRWEGELLHTRRDGAEVIVASRWVLKRDEHGAPESILELNTDITARKRAEEDAQRRQQEIIRAQALAIEELSTPLIPITDDILVMPLIGMLDSLRAKQVMQSLLGGLAASRGRFAILDITGVPVVDTAVANAILQAAHAARLLGTEVIITGIRPEVAQTLVHIDAQLSHITTRGTLQSGISYALGRRRLGERG